MAEDTEILLQRIRELEAEIDTLKKDLGKANRRIKKLEKTLEEALRASKRQAGPFSKGDPKKKPDRPGRKKGKRYGKRGCRKKPDRVDEVKESLLPDRCPFCGCEEIQETCTHEQFVTDPVLPIEPKTTQFNVHEGECANCHKRLQGRHPDQHSDAIGAANVQIGPNAIAFAAILNKIKGVGYEKMSRIFALPWDLTIPPSTLVRGLERLAKRGLPVYEFLIRQIQKSPVVYPDETGWKIGGKKAWLWVFVGDKTTVYRIKCSRAYKVAEKVLGADYNGLLGRDGWHSYDLFIKATHQLCNAHLINRCGKLLEASTEESAACPRAVKAILKKGLSLRDRSREHKISEHGFRIARSRLRNEFNRELKRTDACENNERFLKHLRKHSEHIFTYLEKDVEATNWKAEQALRPATANRKMSCGNRTEKGAQTQEVLMSIIRSCRQQGIDPHAFLVGLQKCTNPAVYAQEIFGIP